MPPTNCAVSVAIALAPPPVDAGSYTRNDRESAVDEGLLLQRGGEAVEGLADPAPMRQRLQPAEPRRDVRGLREVPADHVAEGNEAADVVVGEGDRLAGEPGAAVAEPVAVEDTEPEGGLVAAPFDHDAVRLV